MLSRVVFWTGMAAAFGGTVSASAASAETFYGFCYDIDDERNVSSLFTYEGTSRDYEVIKDQWEVTLAAKLGKWERLVRGKCLATADKASAEERHQNYKSNTNVQQTIPFAPVKEARATLPSIKPQDEVKAAPPSEATKPSKSAAQLAAEEAAARRAEREAEFQRKQAQYERGLAEHQRQIAEYEQAKAAVARQNEANRAKAEKARAEFQQQTEAHEAEVARYESEVAAQQVRANFDRRNGLGQGNRASTEDDANRCVSSAELHVDDTFKGNTAAYVVNGCGQAVDLRICLMTEVKGWNCGVIWGVASQSRRSHSSFHATGQVFVDARVAGSNRPLASPE